MKVLEIKNTSKSYGRIKALNNLNLSIEQGNIYGILGPNGSGKTTTLGIILGILSRDEGEVIWFENQKKRPLLSIGALLETPNFYPYLNATQNLEIIAKIKDHDQTDFTELLKLVNLYDRRRSKFRTYSLGMKQRLAIAATLIGEPEVIIFDEPTNGLDPQGIAEIRNILKRIAGSGKTVIMASHILDEVEKICSHIAIIKNGHLLATGPIGQILDQNGILEIEATNREKLELFLKTYSSIRGTKASKTFVECTVDSSFKMDVFVETLLKESIIPTHLVYRKRQLEEEFLEIIHKNA